MDLKLFYKNQEKMQIKNGLHNNKVLDQIKNQIMNQEYFLDMRINIYDSLNLEI